MIERKGRKTMRTPMFTAVLGSLLILAGCQTGLVNGPGSRIRNGYGITIGQGAATGGTYQSDDLLVRYQYRVDNSVLTISGEMQLKDSIRMNFLQVNRFNLGIVFGDARGCLLGGRSLVSRSHFDVDDPVAFQGRIPLPPGTAQMAFTYQGSASEGPRGAYGRRSMGGDGQEITFWEYPVVR